MDLFSRAAENDLSRSPLAERMRPRSLDEIVGQEHVLGAGKLLRRAIEGDKVPSMILWGPPGTGKTTIARVLARQSGAQFEALSAVLAGVKEIRELVGAAQDRWAQNRTRTILFVDEIHRFNKNQQDALLPHVEKGTVTLVGATTENPSFEVNNALLSRCQVVTLASLTADALRSLAERALADEERGLGKMKVGIDADALERVVQGADGDARRALNALELSAQNAASAKRPRIEVGDVDEALQKRALRYDKSGEEHYNVVSAFIKSMRGSDPDASVYWMARMLEAGEDLMFIARRLVIFAAEDVGNADPRALQVAVAAQQAAHFVGMPEAVLPLTQAATYLATAPKSNTALTTYARAREDIEARGPLPVPMKLRNASTKLMKNLGYGGGYQYPHEFEGHYVPEEYLPDELVGKRYYEPTESGREREIKERMEGMRKKRGL